MGEDLQSFFFFTLISLSCPVFYIYVESLVAPISPGLILIKVIVRVAIVISYVVRSLILELGFKYLFS